MNFRELFSDILSIGTSLFEAYLIIKLFCSFVTPKLKSRYAKYAVGIFWAALNIINYFVFTNGMYQLLLLMKLVIYTFGLLLFSTLWYKGGILSRFFPALLFVAVRELSAQLTNCFTVINGYVVDITWFLAEQDILPIEWFPTLVYAITTIILLLIDILREFIIYRIVKGIIGCCRTSRVSRNETASYILPSAVGIMVSAMLRLILIQIENGYTIVIYVNYPLLYIIVPIMSAGLLASVYYSFRLHQDTAALKMRQADEAVLESSLKDMQAALAEKQRLYEEFSAVRHDMKNNLSTLSGLILRKCPDDEEISRFFESMNLSFSNTESGIQTGNAVCDAIISGKFTAVKDKLRDITLDADGFLFTDETGIDPYDAGIILSNALDNAIEACAALKEKDPAANNFITVRSFTRGRMFFIETENSFDGVISIDEKTGLPLSDKNDGALHGIGLRNIKSCAEKYGGHTEFIAENKKFILSVMMRIRQGGKDVT